MRPGQIQFLMQNDCRYSGMLSDKGILSESQRIPMGMQYIDDYYMNNNELEKICMECIATPKAVYKRLSKSLMYMLGI
jgi:hypothetical protein